MKVKIGGYPNRLICNIHSNHMNKKYDYLDWPDNQDYEDYVLEAIEDGIQKVYDVFNWIWFDRRTQKIKVRIDPPDTWSMDHTLAHIILPMLVQLKRTKHGAPCTNDKDVPKELRSTSAAPKENEYDTDDNHFKRWDWILDEMIWAFHQKCRDDWESDYYEYKDDNTEQFGLKLVWEDREGAKAHQERMTNGFMLFGKYYENLWD
jgi:hypothetical protein